MALAKTVTSSAIALCLDDPKAVAMTVANTLQPYMMAFSPYPMPRNLTPCMDTTTGQPSTTPVSKMTESIVLEAFAGNLSHEVANQGHTFPTFPGDVCRDDFDL